MNRVYESEVEGLNGKNQGTRKNMEKLWERDMYSICVEVNFSSVGKGVSFGGNLGVWQ